MVKQKIRSKHHMQCALAGRKGRYPLAEEMVWASVIIFLVHTTRHKQPVSKTDSLSPHLEELLFPLVF